MLMLWGILSLVSFVGAVLFTGLAIYASYFFRLNDSYKNFFVIFALGLLVVSFYCAARSQDQQISNSVDTITIKC